MKWREKWQSMAKNGRRIIIINDNDVCGVACVWRQRWRNVSG
jgi:hypothetical protein